MTEIVKVEKLPIAVQVQFTQEDGIVITLEGPVAYKSGDAHDGCTRRELAGKAGTVYEQLLGTLTNGVGL